MTDSERLDPERVHMLLQESVMKEAEPLCRQRASGDVDDADEVSIQTRQKLIRPRGLNQTAYLKNIFATTISHSALAPPVPARLISLLRLR